MQQFIIADRKPVLIFDVSGMLSAAICIKVMLDSNKVWSKEIATAFIMNKRYEAKDIPSWLYSQILLPGKQRVKSEPLEIPPQN